MIRNHIPYSVPLCLRNDLTTKDKIPLVFFKENLIPILLKLFHTIETEGTWPNSFYKATDTLIPKLHKDATEKRITDQSSS